MESPDGLTESDVRRAVREEMSNAGASVLSTVFWTLLAAFAVLVGLQSIQLALYTTGLAAVGFVALGVVITAASIYLLYSLHWN